MRHPFGFWKPKSVITNNFFVISSNSSHNNQSPKGTLWVSGASKTSSFGRAPFRGCDSKSSSLSLHPLRPHASKSASQFFSDRISIRLSRADPSSPSPETIYCLRLPVHPLHYSMRTPIMGVCLMKHLNCLKSKANLGRAFGVIESLT